MNDNFVGYQDALINFTLKNKTIYLDKIYKDEFLDLYNLKKFNDNLCFHFKDFIFSNENNILKIVDDPLEWQNLKIDEIRNLSYREKNDELKKYDDTLGFDNYDEYRNFLDTFYKDKVNKSLDILNEKYYHMSNVILDLEILNKNFKNQSLYIGYPFVEGYVDGENYIKMPIFLVPVKLFNENNSWYLGKDFNSEIEINNYLLLILKRLFHNKDVNLKSKYSFKCGFNQDDIYNFLNYLKNCGLNLVFNDGFFNCKIEEFSKNTHGFINEKFSSLKIKNFMVLGNFKTINESFNDYEYLKNINLSSDSALWILDKNFREKTLDDTKSVEDLYIKDVLDYTQQNVIKSVDNKKISLVNSPIGTAKNTTIFNFIIDKILHNQKVLFISRDSNSLEKMYSKFLNIDSVVMKICDSKDDFYRKFLSEFNSISSFKKDYKFCDNFKKLVDDIEEKYSFINDANEIYNNLEKFGLSLQEMYLLTMGIDNENLDNKLFKKFSINNPVSGCTFDEIVSAIDKIKKEDIIKQFISNKEYLSKYKIENLFREDFDIGKIQDYIVKLNVLKTLNEKIGLNFEKNDCSLKIVELFRRGNLSKDEIVNEAVKFDKNYVNDDVGIENNETWFRNLLKGKKFTKVQKVEILNEKIFENAKMYYNTLNNLIDNIGFLEEILRSDNFNFLKEEIFNFRDITDFINKIFEMLESLDKFLIDSYKIQNLDKVILDILDYIYNNSVNEKMMNDNLNDILKFSVLINIMRYHHKHGDKLMKYKFVNKAVFELKQLFEQRKEKIDKFILNEIKDDAFNYICKGERENLIDGINLNDKNYLVKNFLEDMHEVCLKLFPCFMIEHKNVSLFLPMIYEMFDYIIIDDGHDYFVSDVIPYVYRTKQIVIFGDETQINNEDKIYNLISRKDEFVCENLFLFMKNKCDLLELRYSYFNGSEILNSVSNFILNEFKVIKHPNLIKFSEMKNPFSVFNIESQIINGNNRNEANFVVNLLRDVLKNKSQNQSIGIVTLTKDHAELISKTLFDRLKLDREFNFMYYKETKKYFDEFNNAIYIRSIGEIFYDKRDIIIFALGGGFNDDGKLKLDFGEISGDKGYKKLNIFMNLAISEMKIVTSFNIDELDFKEDSNKNINLLRDYLCYAKLISLGKANQVMDRLNKPNFESNVRDIAYEIQQKLIKRGLNVFKNYGNTSYRFDLAIYDDDLKQYILFIDLDGKLIKKFKDMDERNIDFIIYFEKFGCNILKIWSKDLWNDFDGQVNNIFDICKSIKENKLKNLNKFINILENRCKKLKFNMN